MSLWHGLRRLHDAVLALAVVLALSIAALWWWTGTAASLDWAWQRWAQPQGLQAQGLEGALRTGLRAQRLTWSQDGLSVQAEGVDLGWRPLDLLQQRLRLTHLRVAQLAVRDERPASGVPAQPPQALALPLAVTVDEITLGRLQVGGAADEPPVLTDLAGTWRYAAGRHVVQLRNAVLAGGRYSGEATLGDAAPLPVQVRLQGELQAAPPAGGLPQALALTASADGTLMQLQVQARLRGPGEPEAAPAADLQARVTPWQAPRLPQLRASLRQIDLATLWPGAPRTALAGRIDLAPAGTGWSLAADLANARPGPWDQGRLPLARLEGQGEWQAGAVRVRGARAELGGGVLAAEGTWDPQRGARARLDVRGVDPAALHGALAPLPVSGRVQAQGLPQDLRVEVDLRAEGRPGPAAGTAAAWRIDELFAQGHWNGRRWDLPTLRLRALQARLEGALVVQPGERAGSGRLHLTAPGLQAQAEGRLAPDRGAGRLQLRVAQLPAAQAWLQGLPGLALQANAPLSEGQADLALEWIGGWRAPALQGRLQARAARDGHRLRLDLAGQGRRAPAGAWQGSLDSLQLEGATPALGAGTWRAHLLQPLALRWAEGRLDAGAGRASLAPPAPAAGQALLAWDPVRWGGGELRTRGRIEGLPLAWAAQVAGLPPTGDLVFDGRWDARLGDSLRLDAELARRSGDLTLLAETAEGLPARVSAGVREARLTLQGDGPALRLALRWDSERAGRLQGELATRLAPGGGAGWHWPAQAPLTGRLQAQLPRMGVWSRLAPPGWRLRGAVAADLQLAGTREAPQVRGTLAADDLGLRSVVDGVALEGGRLRARVDGARLQIDELRLQGPGPAGGQVRATGEGRWVAGAGPQLQLQAQAERLRASVRADREVTVSGNVDATLARQQLLLAGQLRIDRARLTLPEQAAPRLGSDVVVRQLPPGVRLGAAPAAPGQGPALRLDLGIDLGEDFRLQGLGASARLTGQVRVSGDAGSPPRLVGTVQVAEGQYRAYGQTLAIERGVLRFTGAPANPALDLLALRPHPVQKVGVRVTGPAQSPTVRLYADPDLPEAEKLAWLVLGRPTPAGGAEAALLQQAALSLLAQRTGTGASGGLAGRLGLDELSLRSESAGGAAITLGKRFADNFYAAYERSLAGALGTLYVFYDLTRHLTLRAQAGDRSGVDLIYTLSYD